MNLVPFLSLIGKFGGFDTVEKNTLGIRQSLSRYHPQFRPHSSLTVMRIINLDDDPQQMQPLEVNRPLRCREDNNEKQSLKSLVFW